MKKFAIYYCYGGAFKGCYKYTKIVEGADRNAAISNFSKQWNYEEIYSVTEIDPQAKPTTEEIYETIRCLKETIVKAMAEVPAAWGRYNAENSIKAADEMLQRL